MLHEEALRVHGLSKMLRKIDTLEEVLRQSHDRSMGRYTELDEEDDFFEMMDVPEIRGWSFCLFDSVTGKAYLWFWEPFNCFNPIYICTCIQFF